MKLNEYQELSKRTMPTPGNVNGDYEILSVANYAMGLTGESGEVTDLLKKHLFHGHYLKQEEIKKELGDVLHYLSGLATMFGLTLEDVAQSNIDKLAERYPLGFTEQDSIKRVDEKNNLYTISYKCSGRSYTTGLLGNSAEKALKEFTEKNPGYYDISIIKLQTK